MSVPAAARSTDTFGCVTAHECLRQWGYITIGGGQVAGVIRVCMALTAKDIELRHRVAEVFRGFLECIPFVSLVLFVVDKAIDYRRIKARLEKLDGKVVAATSNFRASEGVKEQRIAQLEEDLQVARAEGEKACQAHKDATATNSSLSKGNEELVKQVNVLQKKLDESAQAAALAQERYQKLEKQNVELTNTLQVSRKCCGDLGQRLDTAEAKIECYAKNEEIAKGYNIGFFTQAKAFQEEIKILREALEEARKSHAEQFSNASTDPAIVIYGLTQNVADLKLELQAVRDQLAAAQKQVQLYSSNTIGS